MSQEKKWVKPQLIILGRGTPEENVLAACKTKGPQPLGPRSDQCLIGTQLCRTDFNS